MVRYCSAFFVFFQAEDGIRDRDVTGVQTCALPISLCTGRSGLRRPPGNHPLAGVAEVAGIGPEIDAARLMPATEARTVDRYVVMALAAAESALADAGLVV